MKFFDGKGPNRSVNPNRAVTFDAAVQAAIFTEDRFPGAGFDRARSNAALKLARNDWRRHEDLWNEPNDPVPAERVGAWRMHR